MTTTFRDTITSLDGLRGIIPDPGAAGQRKQLSKLDEHCRWFISQTPFIFIATSNAAGDCDLSPKGDEAGFVQVLDDETMVIPDRPGNQRADSLRNLLENPHIGTLFVIPGVEWTLRVNGRASIIRDEEVLERCAVKGKRPALGIAVHVEEAFLHGPKCFIRSNLWDNNGWLPEEQHPSFAAILKEQTKYDVPVEIIEKALAASNEKLW